MNHSNRNRRAATSLLRAAVLAIASSTSLPAMSDEVLVPSPNRGPLVDPLDTATANGAGPTATLRQEEVATPASDSLTLEGLESRALVLNPAIARAEALVGAARGESWQVGLRPNPSVGYEGQQLGSGGRAEQHGVTFGQEVITGGKLTLRRATAAQGVAVAEQQLAVVRQRVVTDVRVAYYRALISERQVSLAQDLVKLGDELTAAADSLLQAKEVGRVDTIQANLERQQAAVALENARQRLAAAWRELAAVVGDPSIGVQSLVGDPVESGSVLDFDVVLARIQSESPEVAAASAELRRARLAVERERREPIPNVTFQGLVNWRDNGIQGDPDGGVAVSVPVPLFNRNQGAIYRAERELAAANQAVFQLELALKQRLAPVYEQYAAAQQQAANYREAILPQAEEALRLTRAMYEAGEVNYTALLVAQRTFAVANQDYLDAILRLRTAEAEIDGLLLARSLAPTP